MGLGKGRLYSVALSLKHLEGMFIAHEGLNYSRVPDPKITIAIRLSTLLYNLLALATSRLLYLHTVVDVCSPQMKVSSDWWF